VLRNSRMPEEFGKGPVVIEIAEVKPFMVRSNDPVVDQDE